ncbi:MAG: YXWGXW repeat-containing protein [Deltaproteobacteria bacterium]|nr:YXWGXW repeat-containing protein [Deltaproteobacteria bacterium]
MTSSRTRNLLFAVAVAAGLGASACVARGSGSLYATTGTAVVYQEPPAPQVEAVSVRSGFVWVRGRWDWRGGQWAWVGGHWERERAGYAWSEGRWERRGSSWHWVEGRWSAGGGGYVGGTVHDTSNSSGGTVVTSGSQPHGHQGQHQGGGAVVVQGGVDVSNSSGGVQVTGGSNPVYPTQAPPPVRVETYNPKAGMLWVTGRWDWRNGQYVWIDGHWERERAAEVWTTGRWELQGNYYVWIEGRWSPRGQRQPAGPVIRDHR